SRCRTTSSLTVLCFVGDGVVDGGLPAALVRAVAQPFPQFGPNEEGPAAHSVRSGNKSIQVYAGHLGVVVLIVILFLFAVFKQAVVLVYKDPKVKKRLVSRSDLDPFRFRWLIPASAAVVRSQDVADGEFELVHLRSVCEGRPETVFQLSSSDVESKSLVLETLHSVLKDHAPPPSSNHHVLSSDGLQNGRPPPHQQDRTEQLEAQLQRLHFGEQSERGSGGDDGGGRSLWQRRRGLCQSGRGLEEWRRSLVELGVCWTETTASRV
uniref:Tiam1/2 second PH-like domain-containing protein n=1 Tax=Neogobius melanostomus TaxID=47308 RepID=A0A8C6TMZ6_9GOBI